MKRGAKKFCSFSSGVENILPAGVYVHEKFVLY